MYIYIKIYFCSNYFTGISFGHTFIKQGVNKF